MNRLPLIILAVLVLGSAGFGLSQLIQVQKLTESASTWDTERAALQKRIWDLQKRNGELEKRRSGDKSAAGITADDGSGAGDEGRRDGNGAPSGPRFRGRNDGARFGAMLANPEIQKLMAVQQKAALDSHYSSLFKQLQLSPADLEKFKGLLVEKQSAVMDVMAAARAEGLSGRDDRDQIHQLVQNAQNDVDNTIKTTLGDAAFAQYQNYEATQPQRNVVSQLEQRLSYSTAPLTDTQSQQLVQILADTTPTNANHNDSGAVIMRGLGGGAGGPGGFFGGGGTPITTDAITRAQGILSADQVSALQGLQQEQQANALLRQQMRANFQGAPQGAPAPAANQTAAPRAGGTSGT